MKKFLEEWYPQQGILMAMPHENTDWNYILKEAQTQYLRILKEITAKGIKVYLLCHNLEQIKELCTSAKIENIIYIEMPFNDTWTRDYGPLCVKENKELKILDFGFNGWGLKFASDKDNLVNLYLKDRGFFQKEKYINQRDYILEGGSVETDGKGTILTTTRCLCSPNRNGGLSKEEVYRQLKERLGIKKVLFLDYGFLLGDDTDSHIDTLARIIPDNKILYVGCHDSLNPHYEELLKMKNQLSSFLNERNEKFELFELPLPDAIYDENGEYLPATYANFLISGSFIFMPVYNQEKKDREAICVMEEACPDYEIIPVDCTTLIKQHGSLHCATMQLPMGIFS